MFEIRNLSVKVGERLLIKDLNLKIEKNEVHAIMGPNGAGKSSLANALMGYPGLEVKGDILLDGENIISLPADQRARKGIFLAFQNPQEIDGVNIANLLRKAKLGDEKDKRKVLEKVMGIQKEIEAAAGEVGFTKDFVKRDLNVGFSGGEKKRNEIMQAYVLKPKVVILDEIDSGLDIDALKLVSKTINSMRSPERSFLLITHYQRILEYVKPDFVHVIIDGNIVKSGGPELAHELEKKGYKWL